MQENLDPLTATDTQLVGINYDSVEILKKFTNSAGITFPLLADPGSKTIRAFGILAKKGLPRPCTYVIGPDRKVLAAIFLDGFRDRHTPADLIQTISELAP